MADITEKLAAAVPGDWLVIRTPGWAGHEPYLFEVKHDPTILERQTEGYAIGRLASLTPQKVRLSERVARAYLHEKSRVAAVCKTREEVVAVIYAIRKARAEAEERKAPLEAQLKLIVDAYNAKVEEALA